MESLPLMVKLQEASQVLQSPARLCTANRLKEIAMHIECTCPTCGGSFLRAPTSHRRYCSPECRPTSADRFWAKVDKNGPEHTQRPDLGRCWVWIASVGSHGYGNFWVDGTKYGNGQGQTLSHIWAYETLVGPFPEGLKADHLCHTFDPDCPGDRCLHRRCVNPRHIEPVTEIENIRRGQSPYGKKFRQTHCLRGHQDWYIRISGRRQCRTCARELQAKKRQVATRWSVPRQVMP